jgi:hypothetical protein
MVTDRPLRRISSASWMPVADAPTTSTPRSSRSSGDLYVSGVHIATASGTCRAIDGTFAMFAEPLASTTAAVVNTPLSVVTSYPVPTARTLVTLVPV